MIAGSVYAHCHELWSMPAYSVYRGRPPAFRLAAIRSRETDTGTGWAASPWNLDGAVSIAPVPSSRDALPQQTIAAGKNLGRLARRFQTPAPPMDWPVTEIRRSSTAIG